MDSDMLPNDGAYFAPSEPAERKEKRALARSKARANKDVIDQVISRLEARVAYYATIDSIPVDVLPNERLLGFHMAANHQTVANLQLEIEFWKGELRNVN